MLSVLLVALITLWPMQGGGEPKNSPEQILEATSTEPFIATTTEEVVIEDVSEWKYPELKRICSCESTGSPGNEPRQFNEDGTLLKGVVNPNDWGMCQINTTYHKATADSLGLDLTTKEGNRSYAEYLYESQGSTPWNWSKHCWSR